MTSFLNLFVVIVAASAVAEEFSRGTIKFLLIRPFSRSQILAAKAINTPLICFAWYTGFISKQFSCQQFVLVSESPFTSTDYNQLPAIVVALVYAATNLLLIVFYMTMTLFISAVIRLSKYGSGIRE